MEASGAPPPAVNCAHCDAPATGHCLRCGGAGCDRHRPRSPRRRCARCELEFRPFGPRCMLWRLPLSAVGLFIGATAGLSLGLLVAAFLCTPEPAIVRALGAATAGAGAAIGLVLANVIATSLFRDRFLSERLLADLPLARLLRPRLTRRRAATRARARARSTHRSRSAGPPR